jgi:hypothetical protein
MAGSNSLVAEAAVRDIFTEAVKTVDATHLLNGLVDALSCREEECGWRPGRVYFLTPLEPSWDDRTLALTARSASHPQL